MAVKQSNAAKGTVPIAFPAFAGAVVAQRYSYSAVLAAADIIELAPIPPGLRVVDMIIDSADLDSSTGLVFDVGIMSGAWGVLDQARTCGAEFVSGSTLGQAGGVFRPTLASAYKQAAAATERSIGLKVTTVATTPVAGEIGITVFYAS